jgi:hypothetical protein
VRGGVHRGFLRLCRGCVSIVYRATHHFAKGITHNFHSVTNHANGCPDWVAKCCAHVDANSGTNSGTNGRPICDADSDTGSITNFYSNKQSVQHPHSNTNSWSYDTADCDPHNVSIISPNGYASGQSNCSPDCGSNRDANGVTDSIANVCPNKQSVQHPHINTNSSSLNIANRVTN